MASGIRLRVRGRVQGVGFRPFVWRLAQELGLSGRVRNGGAGVVVEAWGAPQAREALQARLQSEHPILARIDGVEISDVVESPPASGFSIADSAGGLVATDITPDAATCADCLAEILDPTARRYRYPFTNCTQCGPRLSIVTGIPYDRAQTTMAAFEMCDACRAEYEDPADRRFHAQPIACPDCGPTLWLENREGRMDVADPIAETARRLTSGLIVAIKGIGGFHLACDACLPQTIAELRRRKNRPAKPFAIMARDLAQVRELCHLSEAVAQALQTPAAPIVLLDAKTALPGIAPGLTEIGVMLPYTPLHHLLMRDLDGPIVLTSGNLSSAPQMIGNDAARTALSGIADLWLMHDRDIETRLDDSVMRVGPDGPAILRRGRGVAPGAIPLPDGFADAPPTLAMGGDLKSAFCLLTQGRAIPGPHIGELSDADTFADFRRRIAQFRDLYRFNPDVIAIDRHPDYLSARVGRALAQDTGARIVGVQHHHAHLASCLAENQAEPDDDQTIGVILDGTGFGEDGTIWGGEILLGGYREVSRRAHLPPVPLPGGDLAMREPWRNTAAHLRTALGPEWRQSRGGSVVASRLAKKPLDVIDEMMAKDVNCPRASSAGRLFDAIAGALLLCDRQSYEGEAAMKLEALAGPFFSDAAPYPVEIETVGGVSVPSWEGLWRDLLADLDSDTDPGVIAARAHQTVIAALLDMTLRVASETGVSRVALSGGAMQNRLIVEALAARLRAAGIEVLTQARVPCNDGGLALGQAAVAARQTMRSA